MSAAVSQILARSLALSDSSTLSPATLLALSLVGTLSQPLAGILTSLNLLTLSGTSCLAVLEFSTFSVFITLVGTFGDLSTSS